MTYTFKLSHRLAILRDRAALTAAVALLVLGCSEQGSTGPGDPFLPDTAGTASIASLNVEPAIASKAVGDTLVLAAIMVDTAGQVITNEPVTWTSDAPAIASVSSAGVVITYSSGQTKIRAHSHGRTDSATVVVVDTTTTPAPDTTTPPPDTTTPPAPTGAWPHEPGGFPLITDNGFGQLTGNGWDIAWNDAGNASIVSDPTAPLSPSSVLEMRYPVGFAGGSGPANEWHPLPNLRRMYSGFWWKASSPWQGHASNVNKILFAFPASGGDIYLAMYGPPGGPYDLRVLPQFPGITSEWLTPNVTNVPVTVGSWHRIEWVIDYSAGGTGGVVQWWMDGVLIGDHRGLTVPSGAFVEYKVNPTWGGAGDTKQENDYFRYDHIRISGN